MKNAVFWGVAPTRSTGRHIPEDGILQTLFYLIWHSLVVLK
jgi:hypothetical protein